MAAPKTTLKAPAPQPTTARLRAAHGYMVHPFTNDVFDQYRVTTVIMDNWIQSQIDAGKLTHVDS
jgi:hypothetical protein